MKNITLMNMNIKYVYVALLLIFITSGYSQNTYDGNYCPGPGSVGDEYATGTVYSTVLLANPSSTCNIGTIRAKVDTQNQVLRLGMDIGNGGSALFRLYLDTDNNPSTGLTSDSFGGTISVAGAEYILEINSNGNGFTLYTGNGSVKTQTNVIPAGLAAQAGKANCNSGATFLEFNVPFGSLGINICDPNNPGVINVTKLASVSGNSPNSSLCTNTPLTFGIPLKGTVGPNSTICSGASVALTIAGLNANSNVIKWQSSVAPFSVWVDIANTIGLTGYITGNLTETTKFRAIFSNSGLCSGSNIATSEATVTVNAPTACSITGSAGPVCLSSSNVYAAPANMTTYSWSLPPATANGATITSATNSQNVTVQAGSTCNTTFKLLLTTTLNGCSSTCEKIVTVNDTTAPTWTTTAGSLNVTLQCSDTAGLAAAQNQAPVATDNCGGTVTYTKVSGTFAAGTCANSGTYTNTWTAKDACNNTSTVFTQVITIQDTTAPTWTTQAGSLNATLECSDTAGLTAAQNQAPVATDNCGGTVTYTKVSGTFAAGTCANSGTYTNTWTANDVCNNTSTVFTQVITIQDTSAPAWTTTAGSLNVTLECSDTAGLTAAQNQAPVATDNCGGTVTYTKVSGTFAAGTCANSGTYTNTWTAKDVCNNTSAVFTQVITIQDTTAPTWTTASTALNVTLECSDASGLATAQAQFPTASDLCDADVSNITKTSGQFVASQGCGNAGTYTNTWTVKDDCGNTSDTFTQVITIQDTTAPTWTTTAGSLNVTLECSDTAGLATAQAQFPTASDLCDADVSNIVKVSGQFVASQGCGNSGTYTNTWTVKDDCGNTSDTFTQVITIQDTTAPTWTTASTALNVTLECGDTAGLATAQAQFPTASDLCDADVSNITKTSGQFVASQGCGNAGTYTNTWTVKDDCGNTSDTFTQVITIQDTTAPTWTTTAGSLNVTLECSDTAGLATAQAQFPTASDLCDADVSNIVKVSGQFVASQGCGNSGTYTNTWTVKDDCGNTSDTFTQVITIQDTTAPTWTTAPTALNVTLECSDASGLATAQAQFPTASDLCDADVSNITKTSGQFVASQGCGNAGTYTNTWTVKDDCGNTSDTFTQVITIQDTTAPTWTTTAGSLNVTLECSDTAGLATAQAQFPTASDLCDADVSNIVKVSGQFVASQGCGNSGTYTNTWTVKDDCGNTSDTFTQVITIQDTTAPTWTTTVGSLNVTLECSDVSGLANAQAMFPTASDLCDADVSNITKTSGQFVASQGCGNAGTYTNTWTVKDDCGNTSDTFTQVITIQDTTAPTWTTTAGSLNVTLECGDTAGLATAQAQFPTASDLCDADVSNIVKVSGQFVASQGCGNSGTYTNTWTVKDDCGNTSDTFTQVITIQDTTAPTWTTAPTALNVTLECADASGLATAQAQFPTASDLCDADVANITKTSGQFVASQGCGNSGTYTNTWTVKDDCGNTSDTFTQVITIQDTTAPTWTTAPTALNVTLECSDASGLATAQAQFPTASDLCDADVSNITKTSGQFVASQGCGNAGTYTNTWTVKDDCGNTSDTFTQVITIQDTTAPTWNTQAGSLDVTLECSDVSGLANAQAQFPTASDLCDADVSNITKISGQFVASQGCGNAGTYTNTWTVKDDCGNTSDTFTQVITIQDTTAPTWTTAPTALNVTLECSDVSGLANAQAQFPTASDLCDADVANITKVSGQFVASEGCSNTGTYTNTWTVKDDCGNTSETFTQVITIQDTTAPTWTTAPTALNVTLECSDVSGLANAQAQFPTASDLCDADVSNITKTSGQFVASQGCGNAGTYTNTWTVKDDCGNTSDTFTQVITIQDTTAPTWTTTVGSLNVTLECSDVSGLANAQAMFPTASDLCDADVSNITKVSGQFVASQGCGNSGTYTNTWTVKDDCGNTSDTFTQVITIQDTTAPTWTTAPTALNVTLECSDASGLATAQAQFPTASDLCDADVANITKTSGQFVASQDCGNSGTYTNTWTVKDDCGNTSDTFTQVITIQDTTAPTWTTAPTALNVTLECSDVSGLANAQAQFPTASDLCDADVSNITKTSGQFVASEGCSNTGTYTNTWTVKDDCGNTSDTFTQVITIQDTTAPTWTTVADALNVTLQCSDTEGLNAAQAQAPVATDNCNGNITYVKTSGELQRGSCGSTGTYTNTWVAKDLCNNTSTTFTQVITIQDTASPKWITVAGTLNVTLQCSDTAGLATAQAQAPQATANCTIVTYTKTSGQFVASEGCANAGTYTNSWVAKDDCGNVTDSFYQVITIEDTTAPTWTTAAEALNVTLECSDASGLANAQAQFPTASDLCDADVSNIVKVSGQFVASEGCGNSGTYTNTWTVKDDCGNTSETFTQVITIEDKTAPTWNTVAGTLNVTLECSDTEGLAAAQAQFPTASDLCDADVSNITKVSGQFVASEGCGNSGTYTNTWTVKDDCGNTSDTFTQVITIEDKTAPTWNTVAGTLNVTLECSDTEGLAAAQAQFPTASDLCDADVSNITKVSGQFVATEGCGNSGTYTNTWTVKDDCGNTSDVFTQIITIEDTTAPTWTTQTASLNKTIECSDTEALASAQALFPTATDACDSDVTNIVKVSGQFIASEGCSNAGTYTNTWTIKDDCGNTSETFTQVITIQDTTKPVFNGELPSDITVSCDAVPEPANIQATDNCGGGDLPIVLSEVKSDIKNECGTEYTLTRKWTTSDCSGNTESFTQIITVRDTTPPTGTAPADVAGLQSTTEIPVGNPSDIIDEADNCEGNVTVTVSDSNNGASGCDGNAYVLTRTYTLTDCAGNKTELVQTFTVDNKVSVSGVPTNVSCLDGTDGSIAVTSSPGATVVITNANNEVVGNTNLPAGTYTLTATAPVNGEGQVCTATATVTITQPNYKVKISGQIINVDTNTPIANVPITLIPQGTTTGPILIRITNANGEYSFAGMVAGSYLVQVQDANLNSAYQLYPVDSSLFFTTLEECKFQVHDFLYGKSKLPVLGDYVWYDTNSNGIQDEWYDANNDGIVTKNIPDSDGAIDYSLWEWLDLNGDGSYTGPQNAGELNAGGFGNAKSANVIVDGPNGYHDEVIIGIQGFWRNRPESENPYGEYKVKLVRDANLDAVAAALGATGLVKVLPSASTAKKATSKTGKIQMHTVCTTTSADGYIVNVTPEDLVHLDIDFGVNCKEFQDLVANDDNGGPFPGVNTTTPNVLNVLTNDTLEGQPITASDVVITTVTPNEFLQLNPDGSVDILPNAPAGTLTMVYQICEADQTSNCDTATVTITIEAPVMTVTATSICVNDVPYLDYSATPVNFTPINGVTITWADSNNNVVTTMTNLPLSGRVLWPGAVVDQNGNGIDWPGWVFQDNKWIQAPDGFENLRPTATVTISVNPSETIVVSYPPADPYCTSRPTFAIVANDDTAGPINGVTGGTNVINVYTNDTLNGSPVNPSDVTLTTVTPDPKGVLTLNPDGSITVAPNTPAGTYTLTYQICENADFGNCDTAIVTVTVGKTPIVANDDSFTNIGCNRFGIVGNVLSNDVLNQAPVALQLVNFSVLPQTNEVKTDPNITVDASGNLNVTSLTAPGTYTLTYQICEKLNPDNCDTGTITITVIPNGVTTLSSSACNDDSTLIDLLSLLPTDTPRNGTWVDTNNTNALRDGVLNALGLAIGNYAFEYRIADQNCPRSVVLNMEINDDCKVLPCQNIVVHNAFSPNGDGINDVFVIDGIGDLTCYPGNTVEIYNRWGILVFETTDYNNTTNAFDGTSRGRTTVNKSEGLPTGTYFYIVTYKSLDGNNAIQYNKKDGYLYLSK